MASSPIQAERIAEEFSFLRPAASYGAGLAPHRGGSGWCFQDLPGRSRNNAPKNWAFFNKGIDDGQSQVD